MPKYPCPICGDPDAYPLWVDRQPPAGCPNDQVWHGGGPVAITDLCEQQRRRAEQQARIRQMCPDLYDDQGNLIQGKAAEMLRRYFGATGEAYYGINDVIE